MGNPVGWRGRNGTTYAVNLRLYLRDMSESTWLQVARLMRRGRRCRGGRCATPATTT